MIEGLPDNRQELEGIGPEGERVVLARAISQKLYVCPPCRGPIQIGEEHVVARYSSPRDTYHQHWHRRCAEEILMRELRALRPVPAR